MAVTTMSRKESRNSLGARLVADGAIVLAVGAWWLTARDMPVFVLPDPFATAERLLVLLGEWKFYGHVLYSTVRLALSIVAALLIGAAIAATAHFLPASGDAIEQRLMPLLNSFPTVGWAILAVMWFKISEFSVLFIQVMILVPFCAVILRQGLDQLDLELIEMGRSFTRSRWQVFTRVALPMLMPHVGSALRLAYGVGWKIATVAELFGADSGLGYLMQHGQITSDSALVFATAISIVILFVLGEKLVIEPLTRRAD